MSQEEIQIKKKDWKKLSKKIDQDGKDKGLTESQYKKIRNWQKSTLIKWLMRFGFISACFFILLTIVSITTYFYYLTKNPKDFCKNMEAYIIGILVVIISNATSHFFKAIFSKL